jgi:hypothetical protein
LESRVNFYYEFSAHYPVDLAKNFVPNVHDDMQWAWTFAASGRTIASRDKDYNSANIEYFPTDRGPYVLTVSNPTVSPESVIFTSGLGSKEKVVIDDLSDQQINSFKSNPGSLEPASAANLLGPSVFPASLYHKDAGPLQEFGKFAGFTEPAKVTTELGPEFQYGDGTVANSKVLPAKEILIAMEEVRNTWQVMVARSAAPNRNAEANHIDIGTVGGCLRNTAEHWSDLTLHYYCQFGELRECYTNEIRAAADEVDQYSKSIPPADLPGHMQEIFQKLAVIRSNAFDTCKMKALQAAEAAGGVEKLALGSAEYQWNWLIDQAHPNRARIFRFVMEAPTFAFDYRMQQNILNAFYRVVHAGSPVDANTDPNSITPDECKAVRQARQIETHSYNSTGTPSEEGSQCRANKILDVGQKGARR